jgi:hypothetical protein
MSNTPTHDQFAIPFSEAELEARAQISAVVADLEPFYNVDRKRFGAWLVTLGAHLSGYTISHGEVRARTPSRSSQSKSR